MASKVYDYIEGFFQVFKKHSYGHTAVSYENNDCFKYFFRVRKEVDTFGSYYLVPAFLYDEIIHYKDTAIPIQIKNNGFSELTETTLLRAISRPYYSNRYHHLQKFKTKTGDVYYGTNGIILDSNFKILIMVGLKVVNDVIIDVLCYINPSVYINEKGTVEKLIIKKILPFICTNLVSVNSSHIGAATAVFKDVTLSYMIKPAEPRDSFNDNCVNNLLIDWENDVVSYLEEHFNEQEN